jgi:hypothetical protein
MTDATETTAPVSPTTALALSMMDACRAAVRIAEISEAYCKSKISVYQHGPNNNAHPVPASTAAYHYGCSARKLLGSVEYYAKDGEIYEDEEYPIVEEHDDDSWGSKKGVTVEQLFSGLELVTLYGTLKLTAVGSRVDAEYAGRLGQTVVAIGLDQDSDSLAVSRLVELVRRGDGPNPR